MNEKLVAMQRYFALKDDISNYSIRYFKLVDIGAPQVVLEQQLKIIKELIQKFEDTCKRLQTIEVQSAVELNKLSCSNCIFFKDDKCICQSKTEIKNPNKEYCEDMFVLGKGENKTL